MPTVQYAASLQLPTPIRRGSPDVCCDRPRFMVRSFDRTVKLKKIKTTDFIDLITDIHVPFCASHESNCPLNWNTLPDHLKDNTLCLLLAVA